MNPHRYCSELVPAATPAGEGDRGCRRLVLLLVDVAGNPTGPTTVSRPSATTMVVTDPAGRTLTFSYSGNHVQTVTDNSITPARTVAFSYDAQNNLTEVVDVTGGSTTFTYDAGHRLLTMRFPRHDADPSPAKVVTNHYDGAGRVDWQADQLGHTTWFDYAPANEPAGSVLVRDPVGNEIVYRYDQGVLASKTTGYNLADVNQRRTWTYAYDPNNLGATSVTDPNGRTTVSEFNDPLGNRTSFTDARGKRSEWAYNAFGQLISAKDPMNVTTTYTYDGAWGANAGNLKSVKTPLVVAGAFQADRTTTFNYLESGHPFVGDVTSMIDPNGKVTRFGYDTRGYRNRVTDPLNHVTTAVFDGAGRKTSEVSARGNATGANPALFTTTFAYDPDNSLVKVTDPLGHVSERHYDLNRNVDWSKDGDLRKTTFVYDDADRLIRTIRGDGTAESLTERTEYYDDDRVFKQVDGAEKATTYAYNAHGEQVQVEDPLGRRTTYGFDPAGNLRTRQDHDGGTTTNAYDEADRLVSVDYSDPATPDVASIGYDDNNRRTSMLDGTGPSTWSWDSLGQLRASSDGAGEQVRYDYQLGGELKQIVYPGNLTVDRHFDDAGNLDWVQDWLGNRTTFGYDENDNWKTKTLPLGSGVSEARTYDSADRLTGISATKGASTLMSFSYGRTNADLVGSVVSSGVPSDNRSYAYDNVGRLCWAGSSAGACPSPPAGATQYAYDSADNLSRLGAPNQGFDAAHQLCWTGTGTGSCAAPPTGATRYGYDARGNRLARTPASGPASSYGYDQANRLRSAEVPANGAVAGGGSHALLRSPQGAVWAWGNNASGQVGDTSTTTRLAPVPVALSNVVAVAAGSAHSLALKADGTVWAWGANGAGQLGDGTNTTRPSPVQVAGLSNAVAIAAAGGGQHSLALKADGTVWAWGLNTDGQLGINSTVSSSTPRQVSNLTDATAIGSGDSHSLAVKGDGTAVAWGRNAERQLGDNSTTRRLVPVAVGGLSRAKGVAGGADFSLAHLADGTARSWGTNTYGQLGDGTTKTRNGPVAVTGLAGVVGVSAGRWHAAAVTSAGQVKDWGHNASGQLGNNSTANAKSPVTVTNLAGAVSVGAGWQFTLAMRDSADARSWGANGNGQLGVNSLTPTFAPTAQPVALAPALDPTPTTTYAYNGDGLRVAKSTGSVTTTFTWDQAHGLPLLLSQTSSGAPAGTSTAPAGCPSPGSPAPGR